MGVDLSYIVLADNPPEWAHTVLDPQLIELLTPDPRTGMLPFWSAAVYRAVDLDRWYLMRNDERRRSVGQDSSGTTETFLTKLGIEWPYRGALRLYQMYEESTDERGLVHGEQVRYQRTVTRMNRRGRHEPITTTLSPTGFVPGSDSG